MVEQKINYILKIMWPSHCRNRSAEVLKGRADIVKEMNGMRNKIENFLTASCSGQFKLSDEYDMKGFNVGMELGPDVYNFILEQATIGYEVDREIGRYNIFSDKYIKHKLLYTAKGIVVD
ncbi:MAG: hypothetical protein VW270_24650 [Candidatus Poseidoniales archaeon]|jgi:hypothetical protein